jgi:hypothetical protein
MDIYHTATDRSPYTYFIEWSQHDIKYYGVRYAKACHPSDLWNPYKTSSKYVMSFIEEYGEPDVVEVRKVFSSIDSARQWEQNVLRRLDVTHRDDYLNKTDNISICPTASSNAKKRYWNQYTPDERSAIIAPSRLKISEDVRKTSASTAGKASMAKLSKEDKIARGKHAAKVVNANMTSEEKTQRGKKGMESRWSNDPTLRPLREFDCPVCGTNIQTREPTTKTCSKKCMYIHRSATTNSLRPAIAGSTSEMLRIRGNS